MGKSNRHDKFAALRTEFPFLTYEEYQYELLKAGLTLKFHFNLSDRFHFYPSCFIPRRSWFLPDERILPNLPNLAFQLGLIELISYWKAACPGTVFIRPHSLMPDQVEWWKDLYYKGLGEFFYLNGIETDRESFMQIIPEGAATPARVQFNAHDEVIIPVGGGKDSIVTLSLLGDLPGSVPMMLNPREASLQTAYIMGYRDEDIFLVERLLDPLLLDLNRQGFLNGHTPFSALLAFLTILASAMTGKKYIALSNESSANEATIPGTEINHQYSKSYDFERSFRAYTTQYITDDASYFSFLRPLNELQIARLFSGFHKFHHVFRSCNAGSKNNVWCGECSKCLFAYIILSPFIPRERMKEIFGKNLLDDPGLMPYFQELTGLSPLKPFECVGTLEEVNAAMAELLRQSGDKPVPVLVEYFREHGVVNGVMNFQDVLQQYNEWHFLEQRFETILRRALHG